jgi:enamine deaminase RidA (YjgF/YER057c/UK114 family)
LSERRAVPKQHLNPPTLFPSLSFGFSQAVVSQGGKTIYVSGQTAWDAQKRIVGGKDLREQTRQALRNVRTAVEEAGGTLEDVVSLRLYVVNYRPADAGPVGEAMREFFSADKPPASTWVGVASLAVEDFLVEIEAIAVVE